MKSPGLNKWSFHFIGLQKSFPLLIFTLPHPGKSQEPAGEQDPDRRGAGTFGSLLWGDPRLLRELLGDRAERQSAVPGRGRGGRPGGWSAVLHGALQRRVAHVRPGHPDADQDRQVQQEGRHGDRGGDRSRGSGGGQVRYL